MVVNCDIEFENNTFGTYYAGQLLSGTVTLKADKPKEVQAVLLKVFGYSLTKWTEQQFFQSKLFLGREEYLSSLTYLVGSDQGTNRHTLEAGLHTYSFACQLPENCPTSFEGRHGCIRYVVKVILIRPWKFDQTYTRGFTVLKMIDLNFETPQLRVPVNSEAYRTFCCAPCKTAPLKIDLHLPQSGYVAGQSIPVTAVVINNTNLNVTELKFSLVMLVRYISQTPQHTSVERVVINEVQGDTVLKNSTRSVSAALLVPATPPTNLMYCNTIKIAYQIEIEAKVKCANASQKMILPVIIGTIPLALSGVIVQQPSSHRITLDNEKSTNGELPVLTSIVTASNAVTPDANDNPTPYYMESSHTMKGNINEEELHAFGPNEFAPLYPVYDFFRHTDSKTVDSPIAGYVNESFTT